MDAAVSGRILLPNVTGIVGRGVVRYDQLEILVSLRENRVNCLLEVIRTVIDR